MCRLSHYQTLQLITQERKSPDAFRLTRDFLHSLFLSTLVKHPFGVDTAVYRCLSVGGFTLQLEILELHQSLHPRHLALHTGSLQTHYVQLLGQ